MSQEKPTVTIPLEQHQKLVKAGQTAELATERLRVELEAERAKTETQRLEDARDVLNAFRRITDHAVANLSPEFIVDLPAEDFFTLADRIDKIIGATQRDQERALIWRERAKDIVAWRERRKARGAEGQTASSPPGGKKPRTIREAFTALVEGVADEISEFRKNVR